MGLPWAKERLNDRPVEFPKVGISVGREGMVGDNQGKIPSSTSARVEGASMVTLEGVEAREQGKNLSLFTKHNLQLE